MPLTSAAMASYFLLDLAWHHDGLRQLFMTESVPHYTLLYLGTSQHTQATSGPLLVVPSSPQAAERYRTWVAQGRAIELTTSRSFEDTAEHLRTLTLAQREQGPPGVFRYADPRLYAGLIAVLNDTERQRLLGPSETMSGRAANEAWQLSQPVPPVAHGDTSSPAPFRLTRRHEHGLRTWRERALLTPLANRYDLPLERLLGWYRQLGILGATSERAGLAGCRRLAQLRIDRPIDAPLRARLQQCSGSLDAKLAVVEAHFQSPDGVTEHG